jgi:DNA polymerase-3 subunit chi
MTQIDFYTHADDKLRIACVLSTKALERGMRVLIHSPDDATSTAIDRLLWTSPPTGFLPHCSASHALAGETPVIIHQGSEQLVHDELLLNLTPERPAFFSRFHRLIEIVSTEEADRATARDRYRFYRDRGYEIRTHDLSGQR